MYIYYIIHNMYNYVYIYIYVILLFRACCANFEIAAVEGLSCMQQAFFGPGMAPDRQGAIII